jgi:hypothetical protein
MPAWPPMTAVAALIFDYRERARELRVFADEFTNPAARLDLLDVADRWDAMADKLERGERISKAMRPPLPAKAAGKA